MTIDEALAMSKQSGYCWIMWDTTSGEIVAMKGFVARPSPLEIGTCLKTLHGRVRGRFLPSEQITRELLEQEYAGVIETKDRGAVMDEWARSSKEELMVLLERGIYPPLMADGAWIVMEYLWNFHRCEVTPDDITRLKNLLTTLLIESQSDYLSLCLMAWEGRAEDLVAAWHQARSKRVFIFESEPLRSCVLYLRIFDQTIIDDLIDAVAKEGFFYPRYKAMMALGSLGPGVDIRAVDVIKSVVYDSTPEIAAERDRVCERILSRDEDWVRCENCCCGSLPCKNGFRGVSCPVCLGLGYQRVQFS